MKRERVIREIETPEQAMKIEETVKTGYIDLIVDYLTNWIAVEEDLTDGYLKLAERHREPKVKEALKRLAVESQKNAITVKELLNTFEKLSQAKRSARQTLERLESADV